MKLKVGLVLALVASAAGRAGAQAPSPGAPPSPPQPTDRPVQVFGVEATRVLLDVVVRDGKDNPVTDLEAADFEVYEDGVRQQVDLFEITGSPAPTAPPPGPAAAPSAPSAPPPAPSRRQDIALVAFVFDRLSPDARNLATKAALTYLDGGRRDTDRVGVFLIDLSLVTLQSYTTEAALIRQALEHAGERATSAYASSRGRQRDLMRQTDDSGPVASGGGAAGGAAAAAAGADAGAAAAAAQLRSIELRMLQSFESLERDQQGYATTNGLLAVVNSLRLLPGRKTVVFFSEGLAIPPAVQSHFQSVISEANRANVSVYAMDAAGLRVTSTLAETRDAMIAAAREQVRRRGSGRDFTDGPMSKQLEVNEDLLRADPHSGLGQLAEDTGGFLVRDTNDLKAGFRKIDADMRFYYALAYEPVNQDYDGGFRKIEVKVRRPGVRVRARRGYFAIKRSDDRPVLPFEAPAVALLDNKPKAADFPAFAGGLSFPEPGRPGLAPILVDVPGNVLTFKTNEETKTFLADLVIVARIKDSAGRVVERMSQQYLMSGPVDQVAAARAGEVLFYREAELAPGRYSVEAIAFDAAADAASVRSSELVVPEAPEGRLRLSSVVPIKRVEQVPASDRDPAKPLFFGEVLLYPNLGEPVRKAVHKEMTFYVAVYSARGGASRPKARITLLRKGTPLAEAPTELPEPDSKGRIQHVLGLPLAQLPAGEYELRLTVQDDRGQDARSARFTVEE
jgi:VWFA-related protein